jgi:hypothetical protein
MHSPKSAGIFRSKKIALTAFYYKHLPYTNEPTLHNCWSEFSNPENSDISLHVAFVGA